MRLLSIVGARPQFIKVAVIASSLKALPANKQLEHRILHTGQHYDPRMSDCFFRQLNIPEPDFHLGIGSGTHGAQTGAMLQGIESALESWRADAVVVYGDTNSTIAGALAASKMHVPVIHVEAGLRSFNRRMPEEINRIATDHVSDVLLCPTATAMRNAQREGLGSRSRLTGDVMLDLLLAYADKLERHSLASDNYALITMHRAENTDDPARLTRFVTLLERLPLPAILPMHPRVRARLTKGDLRRIEKLPNVQLIDPCEYGEMLSLERDARMILTDSGGVQKEAYFLGVPCLTLRAETEWGETLADGWNRIVDMEADAVLSIVNSLLRGNGFVPHGTPNLSQFGSGKSGEASVQAILELLQGEAS
jgi:UDP-GlcNAc3NAcA epimerase